MVVWSVSDEQRIPDPDFSFDNLDVTDLPNIPLEFPGNPELADIVNSTPNPKANKKRWWESKKKTEREPRSKAKKPMPPMPNGGLKAPIVDIYIGLSLGLMPFNATVAKAVADSADQCAEAWVELAKTNPAVKRFLIRLATGSAAGKLFWAHSPILLAVVMSTPQFQKSQGERLAAMAEMFANAPKGPEDES